MKCVKNIVTDQVKRISDDDAYKLVSKDNIILAMGNKKDMVRLRKKTPGSFLYLSDNGKIGEKIQ